MKNIHKQLIGTLGSFVLLGISVFAYNQLQTNNPYTDAVLGLDTFWMQTDWSGGSSSSLITTDVSTFLSENAIDASLAGEFKLEKLADWPVSLDDWSKRQAITISNTGVTKTDYQVKLSIDYLPEMQMDFEDLRFVNLSGDLLDYWIESKTDTTNAIVWVEVDVLNATGDTELYMYYGNPVAVTGSDGDATFVFFDDFEGAAIDTDKWTEIDQAGGNEIFVEDGVLKFRRSTNDNWDKSLFATNTMARDDLSFEFNSTWLSDNSGYDATMFGWHDNTSSPSYTAFPYAYYNPGTGVASTVPMNVYEDGSSRGGVTGSWKVGDLYNVRVRMKSTTGAFYEYSTNGGSTWSTAYNSNYSSESNLRPGWAFYSGNYNFDNVKVRQWLTSEPTSVFGAQESKYSAGELISNIYDPTYASDWGLLGFNTTGSGTVAVKVRTDENSDMSTATDWSSCDAINTGTDLSSNNCVTDTQRYIQYAVYLSPDGAESPTFQDISIAISASDQIAPDTNAADVTISGLGSDGDWFGAEPDITWTAGADDSGGNGLLGYCIAIDEANPDSSNSLDPALTGGILQGKDDSVLQTYCPYIVLGQELNLASVSSLSLISGKEYYISIKALDLAGNVYAGTNNTWQDLLSFKYDNTPPTAPFYISLPANFLSSKDVIITWPVGTGGADDLHSGLAGLQYRIGENGTWYGDLHTGSEDINDLLTNDGSYVTDAIYDYPILVEGNNFIYFRSVDNIGNVTAPADYVKGILKLNTTAPSPVRNLVVSPTDSTSNSYAFDWDVPSSYTGSANGMSYCYTVNTIPSVSTCTFTEARYN